ncbi:hypothetical protein ACFQ6U_13905 [Streptomyces sp. NPDC056465]|uniref:hypothetical protein n=1 Tax=Streptomyces sp. NPDC056465 TaxID=3345829 RepID=UPI0036832233
MGRHVWGRTVGALILGVTVAAASGCSSDSKADAKPKARAEAVSLDEASTEFQAAVTEQDLAGGCPEKEAGTCWEQMQELMEPARTLRKAMNAEKSVGADFWTEAYALIDTMEKGVAVGEDRGVAPGVTNRPDVFGSAHKLRDWIDAHPVT